MDFLIRMEQQPVLDNRASIEDRDYCVLYQPRKPKSARLIDLLRWLTFIPLLYFAIFGILATFSNENHNCIRDTSMPSPVFNELDVQMTDIHFNGSLWVGDSPSSWRSLPGDEAAEDAWNSFEKVRPVVLTASQVIAFGKDPAIVAKYNDDYWHFGDDAYVGALDFFHQVHCLNWLRQAAFANYGRDGTTISDPGELHWIHIRHCVDMMMQHQLCHADAGLLTYNWVEYEENPYPDMAVNKKCRDWRQLVEYRDSHGVDTDKYVEWKKPVGARTIPQEEGYWQYHARNGF